MRLRTRDTPAVPVTLGTWSYKYPWEANWTTLSTYSNNSPGVAQAPYTVRESVWDEIHKGPPFLAGGPFNKWTSRAGLSVPVGWGTFLTPWGDKSYKYVGAFSCAQPIDFLMNWFTLGSNYLTTPRTLNNGEHTWGAVSSHGATAWKKFNPGRSLADASVFLGEIRDVPRMLKTTASWFNRNFVSRFGRNPRGYAKVAADNWLNTQFGWLPFIADLRKFYRAWKVMDKWYAHLVRYNGQWQKRGGVMLQDAKTDVLQESSVNHLSYPDFGGHPAWYPTGKRGSYKVTRVSGTKVWFEGSFRYYVPEIRSVVFKRKAIAHLFGLDLNPSLIWELTPWSWLVDWFTNVGDVISNSNTGLFDNLVARYAYLMGTKSEQITVESWPAFPWRPKHSWTASLERKTRKEANNFGFDLSDGDLSARQWSILGALGITRVH